MRRKALFVTVCSGTALAAALAGTPVGAVALPAPAASLRANVATPDIHYTRASKAPHADEFSCQSPTAYPRCYVPQQIRKAYDIQPLLNSGITGAGRTIVIVDAYQSPTIAGDLQLFDSVFGLPDPRLNVIAPDGLTAFDPNSADQLSWSGEISLDVEWSHAVAPGATIDLVLAKSDQDADILSATKFAVDHNLGDVISQSFGEADSCSAVLPAEHQIFAEAALKGITLIASSGDDGSAQPTCDGLSYFQSASTPATDPLVLGVGGTSLTADDTTGVYQSETVWNDDFGASGGGFSSAYGKPLYQYGTAGIGTRRGVPDVAYNADVATGVLVAWGAPDGSPGGIYVFGGTSAGSPQWAGITALGAQRAHRRLGLLNPGIYLLGHTFLYRLGFHDITVGDNTYAGPPVVPGYQASRGWDPTTGWGTPDVARLLPLLTPLTFGPAYEKQLRQAVAATVVGTRASRGTHSGSKQPFAN